jgi:hypothetical protein
MLGEIYEHNEKASRKNGEHKTRNALCVSYNFAGRAFTAVFLKLSSAAVRQVVHGGPQTISDEQALQKLYQTLNERKTSTRVIHVYVKVPLLFNKR